MVALAARPPAAPAAAIRAGSGCRCEAGLAEAGTVWQAGDDRILSGVR